MTITLTRALLDALNARDELFTYFSLTAEELKDVPQEDCAGPDKSFPIRNAKDVTDAWDLAGHAEDPAAVRAKIKEIARRKGLVSGLPGTAKMSFSGAAFGPLNDEQLGSMVPYAGKVFEAGDYPDKAFQITESELADRANKFAGVDLDLEHSPFKDLLGNSLGRLDRIIGSGKDAIGQLSIPRWLHDLAGGKLQTSLSFDRDKNIIGCALTLNPRIPDAQVVRAFAQFAGARHSKADMDMVQYLHDTSAKLGAVCSGAQMGARHNGPDQKAIQDTHDLAVQLGAACGAQMATPPAAGKAKENIMTSLKDRLKVLFGKAPDALKDAGIDPAELDRVEFKETVPPIDPAIQAQLAEFKATNDRLVAGQLQTSAAMFADEMIRAAKAVPAQREHLVSLFKSAAIADGGGVVKFSDNGLVAEGANMKALRDLFKDAQPHNLFTTQIPNADPNAGSGAPDATVVERLRNATSLGQQTKKDGK